jgi:hypothetical protein
MKLPTEMTVTIGEQDVSVRYDYDRGEPQSWNGLTGVGSPGYDPCVEITEVRFPAGAWETPDRYPQIDWSMIEDEVLQRLAELYVEEQAAYSDYMYDCAREDRMFWRN